MERFQGTGSSVRMGPGVTFRCVDRGSSEDREPSVWIQDMLVTEGVFGDVMGLSYKEYYLPVVGLTEDLIRGFLDRFRGEHGIPVRLPTQGEYLDF